MSENITVMTWNVHGEIGASNEKIRRQTKFFDKYHSDTDLFLLQAVNYDKEEGGWTGQLGKFLQYFGGKRGYYCTHTGDWAYELYNTDIQPYHNINAPFNRCNLTVSKWPIDRQPLDLRNRGNGKPVGLNYFYTNFPTGLLVSDVHHPSKETSDGEGLEVWNTGIIHGAGWKEEKVNALETVYARIYLQNKKTNKDVILGGDFNAPKREMRKETEDGAVGEIVPHNSGKLYYDKPFYGNPYRYQDGDGGTVKFPFKQRWGNAESYIFDSEKSDWDMRDAYWHADESLKRSSSENHSFDFNRDGVDSKRLDHILVDDHFSVVSCEIQNGEHDSANGFDASDHAPVVAELEIS
jgi:endonuclease/exonuclease/phosphatase family metal-dependent hydrolase